MRSDDDVFVLVLKPVPEAIKDARDLIGFAFQHWGLEDYAARLVVSELVTNAWRVSADGQHIVVRAYLAYMVRPTIEVWDQCEELPVRKATSLTDEGGRGLFVVDRLVARWGTRPVTEGGKIVWAEFPPLDC